ncbi:MAG: hypothetical protein ABH884_02885 [Candidatus Komeilibacteria bacterium]
MIASIIPLLRLPSNLNFFDYLVPTAMTQSLRVGSFVVIEFRKKKVIGLVHDFKKKSSIKTLKYISRELDPALALTSLQIRSLEQIAKLLNLSWPQTADVLIPQFPLNNHQVQNTLPVGKKIIFKDFKLPIFANINFVQYQLTNDKVNFYQKLVRELKNDQQLFILCANKQTAFEIASFLQLLLRPGQIALIDASLNKNQLKEYWQEIKYGKIKVAIGTRKALFFPFKNLAYFVIDQTSSEHHYQWDQKPRYHSIDLAVIIAHNLKAKLLYLDCLPSPEIYWQIKNKTIKYLRLNTSQTKQQIDFIKMSDDGWLNYQITTAIDECLQKKRNVLILANRLHHSRLFYCADCHQTLQCRHCQTDLNYDQENNNLICANCLSSQSVPTKCPQCQSSKLLTKGLGIQKIQEQLKVNYPDHQIIIFDKDNGQTGDLTVASTSILPYLDSFNFGLIIVPIIEQFLTPIDLNTNWQVNYLLSELVCTRLPVIVQSFTENSVEANYRQPLKFLKNEIINRQALALPPTQSILKVIIKVRQINDYTIKFAKFKKSVLAINSSIVITNAIPAKPFLKNRKYHYILLLKTITLSDIEKIMKISYDGIVFDLNPFKILS